MAPRPRRFWIIVAVLVALPVLAFGAVYTLFFTDDSEDELALSQPDETDPTTAPVETDELAGEWTVVEGSTAGYRVREKLASLPSQSDAVGRTSAVTGSMTLARTGDALEATAASFEIDVTQLESDEQRRDDFIRTGALESETFTRATFVATGPVVIPAAAEEGEAVEVDATGDLTIHGVTRPVTIPLDARLDGEQVEVVGSLTFPWTDYEIEPPNVGGGLVTVEDEATLEFKLLLGAAAAS